MGYLSEDEWNGYFYEFASAMKNQEVFLLTNNGRRTEKDGTAIS